jgi:hypothetical protein
MEIESKVKKDSDAEYNKKIVKKEKEMAEKKEQLKQMLINQITDTQFVVSKSLDPCIEYSHDIKYFLDHKHENHKHASYRGHSYGECTNEMIKNGWIFRYHRYLKTIGSGTFFPYKSHLIDILFLEMNNMKDYDDNGMIFFKDFVIDLEDLVPMQLKSHAISYWYPNSSTHPYTDEDGNLVRVGVTHFPYMDATTGGISYIKREKDCQIISWDDYLEGVPICFGGLLEEEEDG